MRKVSTRDIYEAAYLLLSGAELTEIEGTTVNGKIICNLIFTGEDIASLQLTYLNGEAEANILNLRRMVGQVNAWIHSSKRKFKNQLENNLSQGGEL